MRRTIRGDWLLSVFLLSLRCDFWVLGQPSNLGLSESLLGKMTNTQEPVQNFRCTVVYQSYQPREVIRRGLDDLVRRQGRPLPDIEAAIRQIDERSEHTLEEHRLALDNHGRTRREIVFQTCDPNGRPISIEETRTVTWDGKNSILYYGRAGRTAAQLGDKQPTEASERFRQPLRQFGGIFRERLAKAIAEGAEVHVEQTTDGMYRISLNHGQDNRENATIDPSQGYAVTLQEHRRGETVMGYYKARFKEVIPGVWFPVEGEIVWFLPEDPSVLSTKESVKVSDIIINDPNFYDGLFHVDFAKGTLVVDHRTGIQHVVGEPLSQRTHPGKPSLNEIAMNMLEEIGKEEPEEIRMFIPKVGPAMEQRTPFVADLSRQMLVYMASKPDTEEGLKRLAELGRGDLAWDGRLLATRGARILVAKKESSHPMKTTRSPWAQFCELPRDVRLPYWMVVVTREKVGYLLSIRGIEEEGIRVTYGKLASDEIGLYTQQAPQEPQKP